jgi:hypothetical protein
MEIGTTAPKAGDRTLTVDYGFVEKTDEMSAEAALAANVANFGADVVNSGFVSEAVIKLQAQVRRWLEQGSVPNKKGEIVTVRLSDDEIRAKVAEWKPGVSQVKKADPIAAFMAKVGTMSPEKLLEVIAQLRAKAQDLEEAE